MEVKDFLKKVGCDSVSDLTDTQVLEYFDGIKGEYCDVTIATMVRKICNAKFVRMRDAQKVLREAMETGKNVAVYETYYEGDSGDFKIELE